MNGPARRRGAPGTRTETTTTTTIETGIIDGGPGQGTEIGIDMENEEAITTMRMNDTVEAGRGIDTLLIEADAATRGMTGTTAGTDIEKTTATVPLQTCCEYFKKTSRIIDVNIIRTMKPKILNE